MLYMNALHLNHIQELLTDMRHGYMMDGEDAPTKEEVRVRVAKLIKICDEIGWDDLSRQARKFIDRSLNGTLNATMDALSEDLIEAFKYKLSCASTIVIEGGDLSIYSDPAKVFCGGPLNSLLSISEEEFALAGKAYAVGLSTASVMHAMRSVESSLQCLCQSLGVIFPGGIEQQDWKV